MKYKELQKKASELGIKAVGVKKEELEKLIAEAEGNPQPTPQKETPSESNEGEYNAIKIFDGPKLVRTFSLEAHGENYVEIGNEFATNRGYRTELVKVEPKTQCPSCGHRFNP